MKERDSASTEQHDVAHQYVHGALNEADTEAFEVHLMDHPEVLEDVHIELLLKRKLAGLKSNHFRKSPVRSTFSLLFASISSSVATAAACLLAVYVYLDTQTSDITGGGTAQIAYLEHMRSPTTDDTAFNIAIAPGTQQIVLVLTPGMPQASSYSLFLMDESQAIAGPYDAFPNDLQEISVAIPANLLNKPSYVLEIHPSQSENTERIRLNITRS